MKIKEHMIEYKKEMKKAILTAIVSAFSFLIALSWRDFITNYIKMISIQSQFISVIVLTFLCVTGIYLTTKFFKEEEKQ